MHCAKGQQCLYLMFSPYALPQTSKVWLVVYGVPQLHALSPTNARRFLFCGSGSGLASVTATGSGTMHACEPTLRLRDSSQALQPGRPQEQAHRQPSWQNLVQQPPSPPHKWLRAELDSARGRLQANVGNLTNMGCLHDTSDTDWVTSQYEHGSGLHQPAVVAPSMSAGGQSRGQQPGMLAQQAPLQLAAQHPPLAAQQPDWHSEFRAAQQPHLAYTGVDARQQQQHAAQHAVWHTAPRDSWQQPTDSAGADRWQVHQGMQQAVRPHLLPAQAPLLQVHPQRSSMQSQRPVLHPSLKGTASVGPAAAAAGVYPSLPSATLTAAPGAGSPTQVSLAQQQARQGHPDMAPGPPQNMLMSRQDCHSWHLQQPQQPQPQQQQLHQQSQQQQLQSGVAQPYMTEGGQKASTPLARSTDGPGLSFGHCITFQHVGGASPASAHAGASPVQGKAVAQSAVSVQHGSSIFTFNVLGIRG